MKNIQRVVRRPECENCGDPADYSGRHPEAGFVYVCKTCTYGQGFTNLYCLEWLIPSDATINTNENGNE